MKSKSFQGKKKKASDLIHNVNFQNKDFNVFNEDNLPKHHYDTVKEWIKKFTEETLLFSKSFEKQINKVKNEKLFQEDADFTVDNINLVISKFHKIIDKSVNGLIEFRTNINDYISTWKVVLKDGLDGESSDSSVEFVPTFTLENSKELNVVEDNIEDPLKIEDTVSCDIEVNKESKAIEGESKTENIVGLIRIRNPFEVNKLAEDVSGSSNNNSPKPAVDKSIDGQSTDGDCVLCSNDEDTSGIVNSCAGNVKSAQKRLLSSADSDSSASLQKNHVSNRFSRSDTTKSFKQSPRKSSSIQKNESLRESSSENDNKAIAGINSEKENHASNSTPKSGKTKINWNTSSESELTDRDWLITSKTKTNESETKKKKKRLSKRERSRKPKDDFSSSEDGISKLCDLGSLKKKKRSRYSSNSEDGSEKTKKTLKKPKKEEISLMDCLNDSSFSSVDSSDFKVDIKSKLKSLNSNNEPKLDDFGKLVTDSDDTLPVLSDSSLDSIFEQLTKDKQKLSRSKPKKESDKEKKQPNSNRARYRRDKLLETKLTDTSSYEEEQKWEKHKMKTRIDSSDSDEEVQPTKVEPTKMRQSKNSLKARKNLFSDSDVSISDSEESVEQEKSEEEKDKENEEEKTPENKRKRKRIQKKHSDSSESEDGEPTPKSDGKGIGGRRNIRKVLKEDSLQKSTKEALKEEEERKRRIAEKQKLYNALVKKTALGADEQQALDELVLDFDMETKEPLVSVHEDLVKKLKPHQAEGIKFMWDSCFESVKATNDGKGAGCILAHCMGLGKTLQVVTLIHTLLTSEQVDVKRVLVVCPLSTVQNWVNEFKKWLKDIGSGEDIEIYNMIKTAVNHRSYQLRDWERTGGVLVLGYNLYRSLVMPKGRVKGNIKKAVEETLIDPGPDVVVCDEGHILKNEKTAIAKAMSKIKTKRRIVLTGTPLQNNLVEYHCMVQFIMPNLLGTRKEFQNRFVHPIQNGQFEDSTERDVKVMKRRAHVLHKMLDGIVQRKDYNVLTPYLPPKYEYVIHVKLTEVQCKLYRHYLDNFARKNKNEGGGLFQDFQHLLRICTHPRSLLIHSDKEFLKRDYEEDSEGSLKDFIDDDSDSEASSSSSSSSKSSESDSDRSGTPPKKKNTRTTRASGAVSDLEEELVPKRTEWWSELVSEEELQDIKSSSKLFLFFTILKHCEEIGDKLLVFSQSLYTLDLIEQFLQLIEENSRRDENEKIPSLSEYCSSNWDKGIDYFRLDGATSSDSRANWCKQFNQANNTRGRLFLISTRAGGLGINLTGANRVIIFDASWNPSYDVQSIFRVYRFGQEKPCYIYRFLSKGTMEEKIYERQVAKLSTSLRVIDEQQIDRHFTQTSLAELYAFNPDEPENRETPILPKDRLMAELVQSYSDIILKHHQHDSLLENIEGEELNEDERKAAWLEFENEKNHVPPPTPYFNQGYGFANSNSLAIQTATILNNLVDKVRIQNPSFSEDMIKQKAFDVLQQMPFFQQISQQMQLPFAQLAQMPFMQQAQQPTYNNLYQQQLFQQQQYYQQQFRATPQMQQANNFSKLNQLATASNRSRTNITGPGNSSEASVSNGGALVNNGSGRPPQLIEIPDDE